MQRQFFLKKKKNRNGCIFIFKGYTSPFFSLYYSDKVIRLTPNTEEEAFVLKKICHQMKVSKCPLICHYAHMCL